MAFKNLADLYNEKVKGLYGAATMKFDNGKPSKGFNDDPLIVRKPGKGYWTFAEGRGLPISSTIQDTKRITLFTLSKRGILFLAKQQLLQTGNTFEHTRIINPAFAVANTVPFVHIKRNLRPLEVGGKVGNLLGRIGIKTDTTDKSPSGLSKIAQLQQETYDKLSRGQTSKSLGKTFKDLIKKIPVIGQTVSAISANRSVGEKTDWKLSRPELNGYIYDIMNQPSGYKFKFGKFDTEAPKYRNFYTEADAYSKIKGGRGDSDRVLTGSPAEDYKDGSVLRPDLTKITAPNADVPDSDLLSKLNNSTEFNQLLEQQRQYFDGGSLPVLNITTGDRTTDPLTRDKTPYLKYFSGGDGSITGLPQRDTAKGILSRNAKDEANGKGRITYLRDDSNLPKTDAQTGKILSSYSSLKQIDPTKPRSDNNGFDDAIVVSIAMGKDSHVQFRAFIKDLNQTANPEYKTYQYIGRIEKFISYVTVQREISFKLGILAFSQEELEIVWSKINYLTGLVFPYGVNNGILQPNIVRLTIGNVYLDQPGYITSLNTNFNDISESWDIDWEVPIGATMDIKFNLIEKSTKSANSPFYGITEKSKVFVQTTTPATPPVAAAAPPIQRPVESARQVQQRAQEIAIRQQHLVNLARMGDTNAMQQLRDMSRTRTG